MQGEKSMRRPFRFGVVTGNALSRAEWVAKARRAMEQQLEIFAPVVARLAGT
jgi:hypothetical protein